MQPSAERLRKNGLIRSVFVDVGGAPDNYKGSVILRHIKAEPLTPVLGTRECPALLRVEWKSLGKPSPKIERFGQNPVVRNYLWKLVLQTAQHSFRQILYKDLHSTSSTSCEIPKFIYIYICISQAIRSFNGPF